MTPPRSSRYRCRFCGRDLPAGFPVPGAPNGAMLLQHLNQHHPTELKPYLARMAAGEEIGEVAAEAFEVVLVVTQSLAAGEANKVGNDLRFRLCS